MSAGRRALLSSLLFALVCAAACRNAAEPFPPAQPVPTDALAADAGTQLAGHFWSTFPEPLRGHQRFTQLRAFEMTEQRARELARSLSPEVVAEWSRFRGHVVQH